MTTDIVDYLSKNKIVAIARGVPINSIVSTARALYSGGIRAIEITFNQSSSTCNADTEQSIYLVKEALGDNMCIGAGTVMTEEQAVAAARAGADFALAPDTNIKVINKMLELSIAAIPGAMTPTEVSTAFAHGASIVKLFPAGVLGLNYVKALKGPLNHIPLMAVGGIDLNNMNSFIENGFHSVGIGSNIVKNSYIEAGEFDKITELALLYTNSIDRKVY